VLTGSADGSARLWNPATGEPVGHPLWHGGGIEAVAFSPDGKAILAGSHDKTVRLWESDAGKAVGQALSHPNPVTDVGFRPDGRLFWAKDSRRMIHLWETGTRRRVGQPLVTSDLFCSAFSPDGTHLLAGCRDRTVRLWELAGERPVPLWHPETAQRLGTTSDPPSGALRGAGPGRSAPGRCPNPWPATRSGSPSGPRC
jgi:WD40 repeat protein